MFQGSESLEKLAHFRHVQSSGGVFNGSTHQDYTDYFEVLPAAALERALFLEADRLRAPKLTDREPAQPGRRRQGGDPAQRPQPAVRRVPVDPAAAGPLRHVPQRAQRLRRLLRAGAGLARRRRGVLRHLLRAGQRAGHGGGLPRRRRDAARWSRSTSATSPARPTPGPPVVRRAAAGRRAPRGRARRARPAARARRRLPPARPGHRPRRLPRPRPAGFGARRRRGRPPAAAAGARRRARHRRLRGRGTDGSARRARPRHVHDHRRAPGGRRPGPGARRASTRSWTSSPPTARRTEELRRQVARWSAGLHQENDRGDVPHARAGRPRAALRPRGDRRRAAGAAGRRHARAGAGRRGGAPLGPARGVLLVEPAGGAA